MSSTFPFCNMLDCISFLLFFFFHKSCTPEHKGSYHTQGRAGINSDFVMYPIPASLAKWTFLQKINKIEVLTFVHIMYLFINACILKC